MQHTEHLVTRFLREGSQIDGELDSRVEIASESASSSGKGTSGLSIS